MLIGLALLGLLSLGALGPRTPADMETGADVDGSRAGLVLWAWERPEDLRFVDPRTVGVAPLVGTLRLSGTGTEILGRRQPLATPRDVEVTAVVRIEVLPSDPPGLSGDDGDRRIDALVPPILAWLPARAPRALQIDFDARVSERDFYRRLLHRLRAELPASVGLGITALASWCVGDPWLSDLPIDDAVPMFFRMGRDDAPVRRRLAEDRDLALELCRRSVGVSTDEPWPLELIHRPSPEGGQRRIFVFHPHPWDPAAFRRVRESIGALP